MKVALGPKAADLRAGAGAADVARRSENAQREEHCEEQCQHRQRERPGGESYGTV